MEQESPCMGGRARFELPDHFAIFCVVLKSAKGLLCVLIDVEVRVADETLAGKLRTLDSLRHVIAERTLGVGFWLRDKVASNSDEYAVRLDNPRGRFSRSAGNGRRSLVAAMTLELSKLSKLSRAQCVRRVLAARQDPGPQVVLRGRSLHAQFCCAAQEPISFREDGGVRPPRRPGRFVQVSRLTDPEPPVRRR